MEKASLDSAWGSTHNFNVSLFFILLKTIIWEGLKKIKQYRNTAEKYALYKCLSRKLSLVRSADHDVTKKKPRRINTHDISSDNPEIQTFRPQKTNGPLRIQQRVSAQCGKNCTPTNNGVAYTTLEQNLKGRKLQRRTVKLKYNGEKNPSCAAILQLLAAAKKLAGAALDLEALLGFRLFSAKTLPIQVNRLPHSSHTPQTEP